MPYQRRFVVITWIAICALAPACTVDGEAGPEAEASGASPTTSAGSDAETETGASPAPDLPDAPTPDLPDEPEPEPEPHDGEPLPAAPPGEWNWVEFPEARCIDGSPTGIGVRYGISDELLIFFEGGGGCFNEATCGLFYASFANFDELTFDLLWQTTVLQGGIFATANADNPVRDWNVIYVPYCTGDVHAGDNPDTPVPGYQAGAPQQFVGYRNVGHYLDRVVPSFPASSQVLVTGISAGGFGAAFNYDRIADAFPDAKVTLIDDSGPPLTDEYLAPCLQAQWRELFNLDATLPADCADCFNADGAGISKLFAYLADKHDDQTLALISAERDLVIRTFFGYGMQNGGGEQCPDGVFELPMDGPYFEAGLYALRDSMLDSANFASYYLFGASHTYLSFLSYYTTTVNGIRMVDWVANVLDGQTSHVSP